MWKVEIDRGVELPPDDLAMSTMIFRVFKIAQRSAITRVFLGPYYLLITLVIL